MMISYIITFFLPACNFQKAGATDSSTVDRVELTLLDSKGETL